MLVFQLDQLWHLLVPLHPPPAGWLLCDGQAINRITFSALFAALGTLYGVGDGATTFNIPDFRTSNSLPRGATNDAGRGTTGGAAAVTLTAAESGLPAHTHSVLGAQQTGGTGASTTNDASVNTNPLPTASNATAPASSSHENQAPFQDVNYIIHV